MPVGAPIGRDLVDHTTQVRAVTVPQVLVGADGRTSFLTSFVFPIARVSLGGFVLATEISRKSLALTE
jgi:hypothetical protein